MSTTAPVSETQTFTITEEISVRASVEQTFQSLFGFPERSSNKEDAA